MQKFRTIPGDKYSEAIINAMANDTVELSMLLPSRRRSGPTH